MDIWKIPSTKMTGGTPILGNLHMDLFQDGVPMKCCPWFVRTTILRYTHVYTIFIHVQSFQTDPYCCQPSLKAWCVPWFRNQKARVSTWGNIDNPNRTCPEIYCTANMAQVWIIHMPNARSAFWSKTNPGSETHLVSSTRLIEYQWIGGTWHLYISC